MKGKGERRKRGREGGKRKDKEGNGIEGEDCRELLS